VNTLARFLIIFSLICLVAFGACIVKSGGDDEDNDAGGFDFGDQDNNDDDDNDDSTDDDDNDDSTDDDDNDDDNDNNDDSEDDDNDNDSSDDDDDDDDNDDDNDDNDNDTSGQEVWNDSTSGLMWQVVPPDDVDFWDSSITYCQGLSYGGYSDWRLPTISELRSVIRGCDATETGGSCGVTDDCLDSSCENSPCMGCESYGGPASGGAYWPDEISGEIAWYWSSLPVADLAERAWAVSFETGRVYGYYAGPTSGNYMRCVRP